MQKALHNLPVFDSADFQKRSAEWKNLPKAPGSDRVVIEWGVQRGPNCFVFPAAARSKGVNLTEAASHTASDERWADFLEFEFVPQVVQALEADGFHPQANCIDLRPIQTQRARRRRIAQAGSEKAGAGH